MRPPLLPTPDLPSVLDTIGSADVRRDATQTKGSTLPLSVWLPPVPPSPPHKLEDPNMERIELKLWPFERADTNGGAPIALDPLALHMKRKTDGSRFLKMTPLIPEATVLALLLGTTTGRK